MRPIPAGYQATFDVVVTQEMTVDFEELGRVHPVYATYWMAKHMELAGRKILVQFLEPHEDGIGFEVRVRHLAPALPGTRLRVVAEHTRTERNRIFVHCHVYDGRGRVIGEGETTQVVLPAAEIRRRFELLAEEPAEREGGSSP